MLMSFIYGFANAECKVFTSTVARITRIERISDDMAEPCGERFPERIPGDAITELVHYRVADGGEV